MTNARLSQWLAAITSVCLFLLAPKAPAQTNAVRQMQFQVVDASSGQPIPGVRVRSWVRGNFETDTNGQCAFSLPVSAAEKFDFAITIAKPGYEPERISWSSAQHDTVPSMPTNYIAHMARAAAIGGIVKNDKGEPIEGARVIFSAPAPAGVAREKSMVGPNYHAERTDGQGRWTNNEVPANFASMTFRVGHQDYYPASFACAPNAEDTNVIVLPEADFRASQAAMTLGHGIVLAGRVTDPSGHPVVGAVITKDYQWRNEAVTRETDAAGHFEIPNLRPGEATLIVQSDDWEPQTIQVALTNGLPELPIPLRAGQSLKGRIIDEAGKPVAGARVELDRVGLAPLEYDWRTEADAKGQFEWKHAPDGDHPYLVAAGGYHPRSVPVWSAGGPDKTVVLRHEEDGDGVQADGLATDVDTGRPLEKFTVHLTEYRGTAVITSDQEVSSAAGQYRVSIDPGDSDYAVRVRASGYLPQDSDRMSAGDGDQSIDFALAHGATRPVTGRFVVPDYNEWIDWTNAQEAVLTPVIPPPAAAQSDDPETAQKLMAQFLRTKDGRKWEAAQRPIEVTIDPSGRFNIQDVAPGQYQLHAQATKPREKGGEVIGSVTKDIAVADAGSDSPLNIGDVSLSVRQELHVGQAAPDFSVKTVDGAPLKLADYRGKFVLLDFWATWCGPCVGEMPNLKAVYDAFKGDARFAMISLSLDHDVSAPKAFARKNDIKWTQGFLGDWNQADVANKFGVQGIPAIFLIGPDGRILEENLRGPAIGEAIKAALNARAPEPEAR